MEPCVVTEHKSVFLNHADLTIYEYTYHQKFAYHIIIAGVSYYTFKLDESCYPNSSFDIIHTIYMFDQFFKRVDDGPYPLSSFSMLNQGNFQDLIRDHIIGTRIDDYAVVPIQSISRIPYYAAFDLQSHIVYVCRVGMYFPMRQGSITDPLLYELRPTWQTLFMNVTLGIVLQFIAHELDIPYAQIKHLTTAKSADALRRAVRSCVAATPAKKRLLCDMLTPRTAEQLYDEYMSGLRARLRAHIIPPLASIVIDYVL
jgi:hypothetical protein